MKTVVSGCSWTNRNYKSREFPDLDTSWKKWDEYLEERYGWDIINIGMSGFNNSRMLNDTLKLIYSEDVERCVIALSEWGRFDLPNGDGVNPVPLLLNKGVKPKPKTNNQIKYLELYPYDHHFHKRRVKDNLFEIYRFIDICVSKDIEVIILQMIPCIENFEQFSTKKEYRSLNHAVIDDPNFARIEQIDNYNVRIMGWPFVEAMGGYDLCQRLRERMGDDSWAIDKLDMHPNGIGHREISSMFMEWYDNEL